MDNISCLKRVKSILRIIIIIQFVGTILFMILNCYVIVRAFSVGYLIMAMIITISFYRLIDYKIKARGRNNLGLRAIVIFIVVPVLLLTITQFMMFLNGYIHHDEKYYHISLSVNIDNYDLYVREITSFGRTSGCLVNRINDYIYQPIPDMQYYVEAPYSPVRANDYTIVYDDEKGELIFHYKENAGDTSYQIITCIL